MMTSTKTGLIATGLWIVLNLAKQAIAPDLEPMDEGGLLALSGPRFFMLTVSQFLANISVFVAIIAFMLAGIEKIQNLRRPQ